MGRARWGVQEAERAQRGHLAEPRDQRGLPRGGATELSPEPRECIDKEGTKRFCTVKIIPHFGGTGGKTYADLVGPSGHF